MSKWFEVFKDMENEVKSFEGQFPLAEFEQAGFKQHPQITLLTCSDSRMPVNMFGPVFNRIFSAENIGNQLATNAGSILYGLLHLHTPLLIIAGHSDCGAVKAAESDFSGEPDAIRAELTTLKATLQAAREQYNPTLSDQGDIRATELAELSVDMQIKYVLDNDEVNALVAKGELAVLGIMVDLHNIYKNGYGKVYITNLNGENQPELIKEKLPSGSADERVKRLIIC